MKWRHSKSVLDVRIPATLKDLSDPAHSAPLHCSKEVIPRWEEHTYCHNGRDYAHGRE